MSGSGDGGGRMKTLGMLGGMSWESTAEYYRLANELVASRSGGLHSAPCLIASVDFAEIEVLQGSGRWDESGRLLAALARQLEAGGAELLLLCTNTMHRVAGQVRDAVDIPFLDIIDVAADAAKQSGRERIGLLGTSYTMEDGFYQDRLQRHGLDVLTPPAADRELVHRVIYDELCQGIIRESSRDAYRGIIDRLEKAGADTVALACTEIELLISAADTDVPLLPTTRLHVEAALETATQPEGDRTDGDRNHG